MQKIPGRPNLLLEYIARVFYCTKTTGAYTESISIDPELM